MYKSFKKPSFQTPYTLVTDTGKTMQFHVKGAAELYKSLEGGTITANDSQMSVQKTQS